MMQPLLYIAVGAVLLALHLWIHRDKLTTGAPFWRWLEDAFLAVLLWPLVLLWQLLEWLDENEKKRAEKKRNV